MRTPSLVFGAALLIGCKPSATVENTTPIASLQSYRTVSVKVSTSGSGGRANAAAIAGIVEDKLRKSCGFESIVKPGGNPGADVQIDLNITNIARDTQGFVKNPNRALMDALLVLTDGTNGELMGTAKIHGKSSTVNMTTAQPEAQAADIVAQTVAEIMAKSGCSGPRIAKVVPPPPPPPNTGSGTTPPPPAVDETKRPDAEAANDAGKDLLRGGDAPGALASFQKANGLVPDARYLYNACIALAVEEQWDQAQSTCTQARGMTDKPEIISLIDQRLVRIKNKQ